MFKKVSLHKFTQLPSPTATIPYDTIGMYMDASLLNLFIPTHLLTGNYLDTSVTKVTINKTILCPYLSRLDQFGMGTHIMVALGDAIDGLSLPLYDTMVIIREGSRYRMYSSERDSMGVIIAWRELGLTSTDIPTLMQEERLFQYGITDATISVTELHQHVVFDDQVAILPASPSGTTGMPISHHSVVRLGNRLYVPIMYNLPAGTLPTTYGIVDCSAFPLPAVIDRIFISNVADQGVFPPMGSRTYVGIYQTIVGGVIKVSLYTGSDYVSVSPLLPVTGIHQAYYNYFPRDPLMFPLTTDADVTSTVGEIELRTTYQVHAPDSYTAYDTPLALSPSTPYLDINYHLLQDGGIDNLFMMALTISGTSLVKTHPQYLGLVNSVDSISVRFMANPDDISVYHMTSTGEVKLTGVSYGVIGSIFGLWTLRLYSTATGTDVFLFEGDELRLRTTTAVTRTQYQYGNVQWYLHGGGVSNTLLFSDIVCRNSAPDDGVGSLSRVIDAYTTPNPCDPTLRLLTKLPYSSYIAFDELSEGELPHNTILTPTKEASVSPGTWYVIDENPAANETATVVSPGLVAASPQHMRLDTNCYLAFKGGTSQTVNSISINGYFNFYNSTNANPIVMEIAPAMVGAPALDKRYRVSVISNVTEYYLLLETLAHPDDPNQGTLVDILTISSGAVLSNVTYSLGLRVTSSDITLVVNGIPYTVVPSIPNSICARLGRVDIPTLSQVTVLVGSTTNADTTKVDEVVVYAGNPGWSILDLSAFSNDANVPIPGVDCSQYMLVTDIPKYATHTPLAISGLGGTIKATGAGSVELMASSTTLVYSVESLYGFAIVDLIISSMGEDTTVYLSSDSTSETIYRTIPVTKEGTIVRFIRVSRNERLIVHTTNEPIVIRMTYLLG